MSHAKPEPSKRVSVEIHVRDGTRITIHRGPFVEIKNAPMIRAVNESFTELIKANPHSGL